MPSAYEMNTVMPLQFIQNDLTSIAEKSYNGFDLDAMSNGDVMGAFRVPFGCTVWRSQVGVGQVIAGAIPIIDFSKQAIGTTTDSGDVGAISLPLTTAAGKVVYDLVARMSVSLDEGDWVIVHANTVASTTTGIVFPMLLVVPDYDTEGNVGDMSATA